MARRMATDLPRTPWPSRRATLDVTGGERWYLVQSLVGQEARAAVQLAAQQYRVFLPGCTRITRHARQFRVVRAPVFAGYLFVVLDLGRDRWRSINGTFGVSRIVTLGDRPSPVPAGLVEGMLDRTDAAGDTHLAHTYRPGDPVRILDGPFAQLFGTLDRLDPGGRARVLLAVMGGMVPVHLGSDALVPAARRDGWHRTPGRGVEGGRRLDDGGMTSD